jgi:hypothetical protein
VHVLALTLGSQLGPLVLAGLVPALPYLLGASCGFFLYLAGHLASQARHEGALVPQIGAALLGFGLLAVSNLSTLP